MREPLLSLEGVGRGYCGPAGETVALAGVSLSIEAGEMVAIVGASGSGKSTLMNLLGCLDRPSRGRYRIDGVDVASLDGEALARLRRERFGFVFQRYHLLPQLDAADNVAMPAVYAGMARPARRARAERLLARLGLAGHADRRADSLSGGQQQRVSIARALMNGGEVILADEPTGALDRRSGAEVMAILQDLNRAGHTVIIVTHDHEVAAAARRVIELCDGAVIGDRLVAASGGEPPPVPPAMAGGHATGWRGAAEALRMALFALRANRLRTLLTMLGIIIGIASVASIVALGNGAREAVLRDIRAIGTNTVMIYRGRDWSDDKAESVRTLLPADLAVLGALPFVDSVSPQTSRQVRLRWHNADLAALAHGGGEQVFRVMGRRLTLGRSFSRDDIARGAQVVVLDANARRKLFGRRTRVIGEVVLIGAMPAEVIGVVDRERSYWGSSQVVVWLPYTTAASRLFGQSHFDQLTVRVRDGVPSDLAERQLTRQLTMLHGGQDFFTDNLDRIYQSMNRITRTLSLLLALVAVISLAVGGIGVMNIMLVSVAERTREIGIRIAVGARERDVMQQFLIEAVLVCLAGGLAGVVLALLVGGVFGLLVDAFSMVFSPGAVLLSVACSMLIGVLFGYLPARNAARLDPVVALARE